MSNLKIWATAAAMVALTGASQAALVSNPNGTVTDTNTNLIWLQNWNVNGLQNWSTQKAWAETTLDGFAGSTDWRLPEISEYAARFTAYGNLASVTAFTNVQSDYYWSGTEVIAGTDAWLLFPVTASSSAPTTTSGSLPWLCAPAMWPPLCRSHRR
jgi:hypothetical protein